MESFLLLLLGLPLIYLKYLLDDHDSPADKDRRRLAEGIELVQARQYDEALVYFTFMAQQMPKSALLHYYKGRCNLGISNYYSAIYDFSISLTLDNTLPETYRYKGQAHYQVQEFQQAFLELDKAVWHTRAQDADALRWRAHARLPLGQTSQAKQDFEKARALGDENAAFHLAALFSPDGMRLRNLPGEK